MEVNERIIPKNVKNHDNDSANCEIRSIHGVPDTSKYPGKNGLEDCLTDKKTKKSFVDQFSSKVGDLSNVSDKVTEQYSIAIAEVMYYLRGIKQDDIDKIPQEFVDFLFDNVSKEHKSSFDNSFPLNNIDMSDETRGIIGTICSKYWCESDDQKEEYFKHLDHNDSLPDDIDSETKIDSQIEDKEKDESLVDTKKDKWYQKISFFFSKIFKKK
ncbi:MAG: hypothetical protein K6D97_02435 [Clostridia bacterium]|nr:hypothetical protein [Clostridia bacterium]